LGIPQASGGSKSELDEEAVDLGAAASDGTKDKGRVVVEMEGTATDVVLELGLAADTTTGATTAAALVCAEVTIWPVAVGVAPV